MIHGRIVGKTKIIKARREQKLCISIQLNLVAYGGGDGKPSRLLKEEDFLPNAERASSKKYITDTSSSNKPPRVYRIYMCVCGFDFKARPR